MPDLGRRRLAVTVDAADALFQLVRVEGDVVVDQPVAVLVQVDALAGGVGGQQDAHLVLVGRLLERKPQLLPPLRCSMPPKSSCTCSPAMPSCASRSFSQICVSRYSVNTTTRSFVQCRPVGQADGLQVGDQLPRLRVRGVLISCGPRLHAS